MKAKTLAELKHPPASSAGLFTLVSLAFVFPPWLECPGASAVAIQRPNERTSPVRLMPVVELEEDVYRYEPANNGAGPMWCSGSTCLVRIGEEVFASGLETLKEGKPLNNCRWTLFNRESRGWKLLLSGVQRQL